MENVSTGSRSILVRFNTGRFQSLLEPIRVHPFNSAAAAAAIMPLLLLTVYKLAPRLSLHQLKQTGSEQSTKLSIPQKTHLETHCQYT
jgi:hypothetical protein